MQSTGHTSMQDRSLTPIQASAITYVIGCSSAGSCQQTPFLARFPALRSFAGGTLGEELSDARPQFGPDAVGQLDVPLGEHHGDSAGVEPGDPGFLDHRREVDPGLADHSPEQRGPLRAVAQGQGQEIEIARAVPADALSSPAYQLGVPSAGETSAQSWRVPSRVLLARIEGLASWLICRGGERCCVPSDKYRRTAPELDINDVVSCHTCLTLFCYASRRSCGKPSPTLGILTVGSGLLIVGMAAFRAGRTKEARMTLSL